MSTQQKLKGRLQQKSTIAVKQNIGIEGRVKYIPIYRGVFGVVSQCGNGAANSLFLQYGGAGRERIVDFYYPLELEFVRLLMKDRRGASEVVGQIVADEQTGIGGCLLVNGLLL